MPNPLVDQGVLNLLRGSVTWEDFGALAVTAPYLDRAGITLRLEGEASTQHGTNTGIVQSPQPYMMCTVVVALLKTQPLSDRYKAQMEDTCLLGGFTVWPDTSTGLGPYDLSNGSIQSVGELSFNGSTPLFGISLRGVYYINANAFNG
jgi:hypothetical protein